MTHILDNWQTQRSNLGDIDEPGLKTLMAAEKTGRCRETVLTTLHQRLSKLRTQRERDALVAFAKNAKAKREAKAAKERAKAEKSAQRKKR